MSTCAPWATLADLMSPCDAYDIDTSMLEDWLQVASDTLYNLTGQQWPGECSRTERPCGTPNCYAGLPLTPNTPQAVIGALQASPWPYRSERPSCGCTALSRVALSGYPVIEVSEVKVDGEVVPPGEYMVAGGRYLVGLRLSDDSGYRVWPTCQLLELADTEDGTFSVSYSFGAEPPLAGVKYAAILACQLALSTDPSALRDGRCRLPKRVQTVSRQGITLAILDTFQVFTDGLTGIPEIDLWLSSVRFGTRSRGAHMSDPSRRSR